MIDRIAQWQSNRELNKMPYNHENEVTNILEELIESDGYATSEIARELIGIFKNEEVSFRNLFGANCSDSNDAVDAYCDIIVYAVGAIMKLGYDPEHALVECCKEIEDRTGKYNPEAGKWVKSKPKPNAYKADYSRAKL